jgi:hypothetical protein
MPPTPDAPDVQQPVAAPDQQASAAASGPQPSATPAPDQSAAPAAPAAAAPAVAPAAGPVAPPQSRLQNVEDGTKHVLGDIFQTIAGGKKIVYQQGPNGEPVKTYQDLKPGEMARGILAAALTGLAAGYDPARRGKGPAMSSAFAGGFNAETEQREKNQGQQRAEAEQDFSNKNLAEEHKIKLQKAATDQQASMQEYTKTQQQMDQAAVRAKQEGIVFDQGQQSYFNSLDAKYTGEIAKGGKPIDDPKNPGKPLIWYSKAEAQTYANEHGAQLVKPGEFSTQVLMAPGGGFEVIDTPLADKEKIDWRFVKRDAKGRLETDSKGNYIPSGEKDQSGNIVQPTRMSGEDYGNKIIEIENFKTAAAKYQDVLAQASERRAIAAKDERYQKASSRMADAGNNPYAMNTENGEWTMNDADRGVLRAYYSTNLRATEAAIAKANTDLGNAVGADADKIRKDIAEAEDLRQTFKTGLATIGADGNNVTKSQAMSDSLLKRFDTPEKAAQYFDQQAKAGKYAAHMLPEEIAGVKQRLVAAADAAGQKAAADKAAKEAKPTAAAAAQPGADLASQPLVVLKNQQVRNTAVAHLAELQKAGKSPEEIAAEINNTKGLEAADKTYLINQLNGRNDVRPGLTVMKDPKSGKTINVMSDDQKQWLDRGYTVVGAGTSGVQPGSGPNVEKEGEVGK